MAKPCNLQLDGVTLQIVPLGTIRGRLLIQGDPPTGLRRVSPDRVHPLLMDGQFMSDISLKSDGSLLLENVAPGKYHLQLNPPAGTYLKSVTFEKQDVTGQELNLNDNPSGELDIVLRYGPAEVSGVVKLDQAPGTSPAAQIVLIPDVITSDGYNVETGISDQNGAFTIKNVKPGTYHAVALEHIDLMQLPNPELLKQLQSLGTPVELKENDKKQISLERIPSADVERIFAKLGIDFR